MFSKLYYIHGYQSSPQGDKGILFKEKLNATAIKYRDVKPEKLMIADCLKSIKKTINNDKNVILIGSSLGGFLAANTAIYNTNIKKLILLNPAILPPETNIDEIQDLPKRILKDMINERLFKDTIKSEIIIIRGTKDEVVPDKWIYEFASSQEAIIKFLHDDHRFSKNLKKLPDIISNFLI